MRRYGRLGRYEFALDPQVASGRLRSLRDPNNRDD